MGQVLKVLVVDDSALIRKVLSEVISSDPRLTVVGTAAEPYEARDKIKARAPDVVTLDIEMPKMDGITFLKNLMRLHPLPVVMLSTLTAKGADETLKALELGAIDFIQKPQLGAAGMVGEFAQILNDKVAAAGVLKSRLVKRAPQLSVPVAPQANTAPPSAGEGKELIVIGSSTGGTEALSDLLMHLPDQMPPIVVAQHIPATFSERFAKRLNEKVPLSVVEAQHGQTLQRGTVYIAPGGFQLRISRHGAALKCQVTDDEPVNRHKPSVEALFDSVVAVRVPKVLAVMLTGMGSDGAAAMLRLKQSGAYTIAQDEESSLVWGMPGSAVKLGAADEVASLNKIPRSLLQRLR